VIAPLARIEAKESSRAAASSTRKPIRTFTKRELLDLLERTDQGQVDGINVTYERPGRNNLFRLYS
jgi:hypothetical protein